MLLQRTVLLSFLLSAGASAAAVSKSTPTPQAPRNTTRITASPLQALSDDATISVPDDCTLMDTPLGANEDCDFLANMWGISYDDFVAWNPSVGEDCSGIQVGESYCVERNYGKPTDPSTTSEGGATPTNPGNGINTPSPVQPSIVSTCDKFYLVKTGDNCRDIASQHGITETQFAEWNANVGATCTGLWANAYACVSVIGHETASTKPTTTGAAPTSTVTPSPVQANLVKNCNKFHLIKSTTTCASIESYYSLPLATFISWNPAVGNSCTSLLVGYYVCVGVVGWKPTTTITTTATSTKPTNGIATPSPIQNNMVTNCDRFHLIKSTTSCSSIESYYSLPLATFLSWNPAVGSSCGSLLVDYYVCVGVVGWKPTITTTTTATSTKPTNGIATPSPIQNNMVKNCNRFHLIKSTTSCSSIESYYSLPFATLISWNPAIGINCGSLLVGYYVCVGVVGWEPATTTTTTAGNGVSTPTPIQTGITTKCNKFHLVKSTTTCSSIQEYYGITMAQLASWNQAVGSECSGLWAGYNVCVGIIGQTPTTPDNGVETPSPIQSGMTTKCKKFHLVKSTTTCASIQEYYGITLAKLVSWNPAIGSKCSSLWAQYYVCVGV